MNLEANSMLAQFKDMDKHQIESFVSSILENVDEGHYSAVATLIEAKKMNEASKLIMKGVHDYVKAELDNYSKEYFVTGAKMTKSEVGTSYDFTGCSAWVDLASEEEAAKTKRTDLEKILKALKGEVADTETGETLVPPIKTSDSYVKITLTKSKPK